MILFIVIIVIIIAYLNTEHYKFLFAAPPKSCPTGFRKQGNNCVPNTSFIQNGLKYVTKNPQKKVPDAYKPLVDSGYLKKQGNTWTSNPTPGGKPPAYNNTGGRGGNQKPPGGGGSGNQKPPGGGGQKPPDGRGQKPPGGRGGNSILPSAPQQQKPTSCRFGGRDVKNCLLQYYNGDQNFIVTNDGKTLQARINPSSYDGSKDDKSKNRNRNEIALRNVVQKDGQTISFNFTAQGAQNMDKNKSAIFFQLKPEGHGGNDAQIRLGVRSDGTIGYGLFGGEIKSTGVQASNNNNIQIKADGGSGYLYINGQQVKANNGEPVSFSLGAANSTQIKFGLEAVPGQINGDVYGIYNNISF